MTDTEERLTRLENLAETTLLAVQQLGQQAQQDREELRSSIDDMLRMMDGFAEQAQQDREQARQDREAIRGLQVENRRILDYLFGEQQRRNGNGSESG